MYNVKNLICEFAQVDVVAVCMVGNEGDVQGADVRDEGQALKEVVLLVVSTRLKN